MVNNQNLITLQNQLATLEQLENQIPYRIEQTKKWINSGLVGTREPELARLHEVLNAPTGYNTIRTEILPTKKRLQAQIAKAASFDRWFEGLQQRTPNHTPTQLNQSFQVEAPTTSTGRGDVMAASNKAATTAAISSSLADVAQQRLQQQTSQAAQPRSEHNVRRPPNSDAHVRWASSPINLGDESWFPTVSGSFAPTSSNQENRRLPQAGASNPAPRPIYEENRRLPQASTQDVAPTTLFSANKNLPQTFVPRSGSVQPPQMTDAPPQTAFRPHPQNPPRPTSNGEGDLAAMIRAVTQVANSVEQVNQRHNDFQNTMAQQMAELNAKVAALADAPSSTVSSGSTPRDHEGHGAPPRHTETHRNPEYAHGTFTRMDTHGGAAYPMWNNAPPRDHRERARTDAYPLSKIPPKEPRPFENTITDWPRFWEEFENYVKQTELDVMSQVRLLKRCLKDEALRSVDCFRETSEDYKLMVQMLRGRFDQPDLVLENHITEINHLKPAQREPPDAVEQRRFYDLAFSLLLRIKRCGMDINHLSLRQALMMKLSPSVRKAVLQGFRGIEPKDQTTEKVLDCLKQLVQDLEREAAFTEISQKHNKTGSNRPPQTFPTPPHRSYAADMEQWNEEEEEDCIETVNAVVSQRHSGSWKGRRYPANKPQRGSQPRQCLYCNRADRTHKSLECRSYPDVSSRQRRLCELQRCPRCAGPRHPDGECHRKLGPCFVCGKESNHISLHCPDISNKIPPKPSYGHNPSRTTNFKKQTYCVEDCTDKLSERSPTPYDDDDRGSELEPDLSDVVYQDEEEDEPSNKAVHHVAAQSYAVKSNERTVLQCIYLKVSNTETQRSLRVPVFLDGGSSQTFVSSKVAKQLQLPLTNPRKASVLTFGNKKTEVKLHSTAFKMSLGNGKAIAVEADVIDNLTAAMTMADPDAVTETLKDSKLPLTLKRIQPEILLGMDYQEFLMVTPGRKLNNGFRVFSTTAGPIVAGKGSVANPETVKVQSNLCFHVDSNPREKQFTETLMFTEKTNFTETIPQVTDTDLRDVAEKILSHEGLGISSSEITCKEEYVLENFLKDVKRLPDGRYEVRLPWRSKILEDIEKMRKAPRQSRKWSDILPTNLSGAVARLNSVWPELAKCPENLKQYHENFATLLARGMMEDAPFLVNVDRLLHHVPHGPVYRDDKPTKLRIVLDAAAKSGFPPKSLNDCLHPGPSLLENMVGILLRTRIYPIVLQGDAEKAFLQLSIPEEDRDVVRIVWLKDHLKPPKPDNIRVLRYTRLPFGLCSSPFLLFATVKMHLANSGTAYAEEYARNMYSDNVFLFANSEEEAVQKYTEIKKIFTEMQMNIREFISNTETVTARIPEEDRAKETKAKTLGLDWTPSDSVADYWTLRMPDPRVVPTIATGAESSSSSTETPKVLKRIPKKKRRDRYTKRFVISVIHKLYDPQGLTCPVTLQARLFYQELWQDKNLKLDDELPDEVVQRWLKVTESWTKITETKIPRYLFQEVKRPFTAELHIFTDASQDGCSAAFYLLMRSSCGKVFCRLLFGKNYVKKDKPKPLTIPRMELVAVLIGCRSLKFLRKEVVPEILKVTGQSELPTTLWCDNQGVLYWIRNTDYLYGDFVQNRLTEIRSAERVEFLYVGTKDNPADIGSRGCTLEELHASKLWWEAPAWLRSREQWPEQPEGLKPFAAEELGIDAKPPKPVMAYYAVAQSSPTLYEQVSAQIPPAKRTIERIRRVTVYVARIAKMFMLRSKIPPKQKLLENIEGDSSKWTSKMLVREYWNADKLLLLNTQIFYPPTETQLRQFGLAADSDGLLRLHDRLEHSNLPADAKFALWLPPKNKFTTEIVREIHLSYAHAPRETVLTLLRERYWLVDARRQISTILYRTCVGCRMIKGPAFEVPRYASHPEKRVTPCVPFACVGVDFFGPFYRRDSTKETTASKAHRQRKKKITETTEKEGSLPTDVQKIYGCIFTCMSTRAVSLHVMEDLSARSFLEAFDNFIHRNRMPDSVISDNAPTFLLTARTLDEVWAELLRSKEVAQNFRQNKVEWRTITAYAPWQGGFYERLIRTVKACLKATVGRRIMRLLAYIHLFDKIASTLNSRPLTYITNVPGNRPLRPIDFLRPSAEVTADMQPMGDSGEEEWVPKDTPIIQLKAAWKRMNARINDFWSRWRTEYLNSLRETARCVDNTGRVPRPPRVGEYVLVEDMEDLPRPLWQWAKVKELVQDADGLVRNVILTYPGGSEKKRGVKKLYPLELNPAEAQASPEPSLQPTQPLELSTETHKHQTMPPKRVQFGPVTRVIPDRAARRKVVPGFYSPKDSETDDL